MTVNVVTAVVWGFGSVFWFLSGTCSGFTGFMSGLSLTAMGFFLGLACRGMR